MIIKYSELCNKEIINCSTGESLGYVCDVNIACNDGRILSLIASRDARAISFKKKEEICISFDKIEKIGSDFIIVDCCDVEKCDSKSDKKDGIKLFFSK